MAGRPRTGHVVVVDNLLWGVRVGVGWRTELRSARGGPGCLKPPGVLHGSTELRGRVVGRVRGGYVSRSVFDLVRRTLTCATLLGSCAGLAVGLLSVPAAAQVESGDLDVYEGRIIREIVLENAGAADEADREVPDRLRQIALNNIRSVTGASFRSRTVRDDVGRLNRLNVFGSVRTSVQMFDDGSVRLTFRLSEQPTIEAVQVAGNLKLSDQQIGRVMDLIVGAPVDRFQIDRTARQIENLYRERGYYFARVTIDERELEESGTVLFQIREGERVRITDIRFENNQAFESRELQREIKTRESSLFKKGQIDDTELDSDVGRVIQFYRDQGYLDVRVGYRLQPAPNGREAIVTFLIEEGQLYTLRDVIVEYRDVESEQALLDVEQIKGLFEVKRGDVFSARRIESATRDVVRAFGQQGFVDTEIRRSELRDPERPQVDLKLVIVQGSAFRTGLVTTSGNTLTQKKVILREVELLPGRPLDTTATDETQRRLEQTRLFARGSVKITPQPPDPSEPDVRDMLIEVRETNTGDFSIGGAVSSDSGVTGRIALTQRNFDLMDTPDTFGELFSGRAFRGAGQTFRAEALPGDRVETYAISLTEPYLFDTDYSGSAQVFYRTREYDEFDEQRAGVRMNLARRFGTRWVGGLNVRAENIDLSNVEPDSPTDIFDVADSNLLTSIGFSLARTSIDDRFRPTRGSSLSFSVDQIGVFGGDFDFTKFELDYSLFIPIFEDYLDRRTVLSITTKLGYIPQGRDDTPTYERFYLGGQSFRGLEFRTVSPRGVRNDNGEPSDDPIGGTSMFFFGVQVQQPIFEELFSVVAFIDSGTVTFDPGFDDYRVTAGVGLRFFVPQLSPAPLAFDFGFPIIKEETDEERLFTFSFDLPF